jgi:hypothetical protein
LIIRDTEKDCGLDCGLKVSALFAGKKLLPSMAYAEIIFCKDLKILVGRRGEEKTFDKNAEFNFFLSVHSSLLFFYSMQERMIILCNMLKEKTAG